MNRLTCSLGLLLVGPTMLAAAGPDFELQIAPLLVKHLQPRFRAVMEGVVR